MEQLGGIKRKLHHYGDTALITGATSGIGHAFVQTLADAGMDLVLVARNLDNLEALKKDLESKAGVRTLIIAKDLSEKDAPDYIADTVGKAGWDVDVLINNAGSGQYCWFDRQPMEQISQTLLLNSLAPIILSRLFLPGMLERKRGAIILVSGILADFSAPFFSTYSASKACVQSFAQALHGELKGSGVDVLTISPGSTATNFMNSNGIERDFHFPVATPERVVRTALKALGEKTFVVDGAINRALVFMLRFMPRSLVGAMNRLLLLPGYRESG